MRKLKVTLQVAPARRHDAQEDGRAQAPLGVRSGGARPARAPPGLCARVGAEMADAETLQRTPLYERHVAAGARLVPFAGWEMPVQYAGIRAEHAAVRERAGVFDVSHMGQVETSGPGALALLQRLLSNDVERIAPGGAQYSVLCREDGGVLDDLFTYRLGEDRYLTVTNAANHARDHAWFAEHAEGADATVADRIADFAMLAVQGPRGPGARRRARRRRASAPLHASRR